MRKKTLIVGAGYLGSALAVAFQNSAREVWVLRRKQELPCAGVNLLSVDLSSGPCRNLPADFQEIVFCIAADEHTESAYRKAYIDCSRNLLASLDSSSRGSRFLFISSTGVYGQSDGSWVDERTPALNQNFNGRVLREAEELVLGSGFNPLVLRLSGIYGPGREYFINAVKNSELGIDLSKPYYSNRIHLADCVGATKHLLECLAPDDIYIGSDSAPLDRSLVVRWLREQLSLPLVYSEGQTAKSLRGSYGSKRCSNLRLRTAGYRFIYPSFREGYSSLLPRA